MKMQSVSTVNTTFHTDPQSHKWSSSKTPFKSEEFQNAGFTFYQCGRETEFFENKEITITNRSFPQTQIQTDQRSLSFQIVPAWRCQISRV